MRTFPNLHRLRRLPILWWASVIALAFVIGSLVAGTVSRAEAAAQRYEGVVHVAVAAKTVEPGAIISAGDIRYDDRPRAFLPDSPTVDNPVGRVASSAMVAGEVFVDAKLAPGGLSSVAALLHPAERAVSVPNSKVGLRLKVNDSVDVIGSFGSTDETALTLAEAARVVDVSEDSVTVAVAKSEAPRVALVASKGHVSLALSSFAR